MVPPRVVGGVRRRAVRGSVWAVLAQCTKERKDVQEGRDRPDRESKGTGW